MRNYKCSEWHTLQHILILRIFQQTTNRLIQEQGNDLPPGSCVPRDSMENLRKLILVGDLIEIGVAHMDPLAEEEIRTIDPVNTVSAVEHNVTIPATNGSQAILSILDVVNYRRTLE